MLLVWILLTSGEASIILKVIDCAADFIATIPVLVVDAVVELGIVIQFVLTIDFADFWVKFNYTSWQQHCLRFFSLNLNHLFV